mgnify:FL=1
MERFNLNANTNTEAIQYLKSRAKQLLYHNYKLENLTEYDWGVEAIFEKDNKKYQSLYILEKHRGKGIYKKYVKMPILTSVECGIDEYLESKGIEYVMESLTPFYEYKVISNFYGGRKANRSGVELMNHIDEGLYILNQINASDAAKKAYCLHPILQSDTDLYLNYQSIIGLDNTAIILAMEYRWVANDYLSTKNIESLSDIRLSPLKDVNDMLIADKIQNRKDFEKYHKSTHPNSERLANYFNNWLMRLKVEESFYQQMVEFIN